MRSAHLSFVTMLVMLLAGPVPADEPTYLLFTVSWVDRQDPPARDQARLDESQRQLDAATEPSERDRLAVELERARADVDRQTGFIVFGGAGRRRARTAGRRRAIDGGAAARRRHRDATRPRRDRGGRAPARRSARAEGRLHDGGSTLPPGPSRAPARHAGGRGVGSQRPPASGARAAFHADAESRGVDHVRAHQGGSAAAVAALPALDRRWGGARERRNAAALAARAARTRRGETLGPIPVHVSIDRSSAGGFAMRCSWEIRTAADVDEHATGVELVAWDWD